MSNKKFVKDYINNNYKGAWKEQDEALVFRVEEYDLNLVISNLQVERSDKEELEEIIKSRYRSVQRTFTGMQVN